MHTESPAASRPFNFYLGFGIPLGVMLLLLLADPTTLDFTIANWAYDQQSGFIGRHSAFLEDILHDRAKQAVIVIGVLAIVGFVLSLLSKKLQHWRRPFGYLVLAMGLTTSIVTPLKALTGVHCPWSLSQFGGEETYTPLLSARAPTAEPGRCWPGGHAAAGFALFALFFVLRDRRPRTAKAALWFALALGTTFSVGRMLQGAHFFSHNLWTALFCWVISLGAYRLVLYRAAQSDHDTVAALSASEGAAG
ncbi:membrane-associated PAP2 superfamily phosphatase [Pseudomonas sp. SJZ079]|uniref:phosphatase PAP2 family protein n=1 Tax=Pseudomonas sp. SJZ079 TaxID=2572887 RepID=UPI00119A0D9E|nr:phosphatase PAP2 family protein [Pseudomonas sp. SJZ079]TWC32107.1 membrane-associated PAP2 superfamily phosphatase [Pseudomonas sp. SJZ079]